MAKGIKHTQFISTVARKANLSPKTVNKVWNAIEQVVRDEVRLHGECRLRNIGYITIKSFGGKDMMLLGEWRYVEERYRPRMKFSDNFVDYINGRAVSHDGHKRKRLGKKTITDKRIEAAERNKKLQTVDGLLDRKMETGENIVKIKKSDLDDDSLRNEEWD